MSKDDEKVDLSALEYLMSLPPDIRDKYCIDTILALADAAEKITKMKGKIPQARAAKKFMSDLTAKMNEILPIVIYTVKDQFRDTYVGLLEKFRKFGEEKPQT